MAVPVQSSAELGDLKVSGEATIVLPGVVNTFRLPGKGFPGIYDPYRLFIPGAVHIPGVQCGVVGNCRFTPDQNPVGIPSVFVNPSSGFSAGYPPAGSVRGGTPAVEGSCHFQMKEAPAGFPVVYVHPVDPFGSLLHQPYLNIYSHGAKVLYSTTPDLCVGVHHSHHHPGYPSFRDGLGAGWGPSMVAAGLKGNYHGASRDIPRPGRASRFGVGAPQQV